MGPISGPPTSYSVPALQAHTLTARARSLPPKLFQAEMRLGKRGEENEVQRVQGIKAPLGLTQWAGSFQRVGVGAAQQPEGQQLYRSVQHLVSEKGPPPPTVAFWLHPSAALPAHPPKLVSGLSPKPWLGTIASMQPGNII